MTAEADPEFLPTSAPPEAAQRLSRWLIRVGLLVAVLGWLWPIGVGGQIPVGGDATQFSMGLMAFLRSSLVARRWPIWNDLWGLGFPGLAESQMGVYYPPHWGYALLSTETAYAASLVAHFLWGATGAAWAARRFGVSELGSALSGFAWATSGFFLIHLPHQWAYTVGSWMPWAWGLTWHVVRSTRFPARPALILSAVLAIQILPGHFQMAFITEVSVLALAVLGAGRERRGVVAVVFALVAALPLAAAQLLPTGALARLSGGERGFEYLSGFAASPLHLVSYVAPGLFHRSPLWRPIAWDLFHTAPEEYLGYVGLVPLFLSLRALVTRGWARPEVRVLGLVGLLSVFLSLGPYAPGFRWLITLPGFSFFRAPARWSLATNLALAILAGIGFDAVRSQGSSRRSVMGFVVGSILAVGLVIGGFESALQASRGVWLPGVAPGFDDPLKTLPWAGQPGEPTFRGAMTAVFRPQNDLRVQSAQARLEGKPFPPSGLILAQERGRVYARELTDSGVVIATLVLTSLVLAKQPRGLAWAFGALTVADLIWQGQARPFDLGPIRSLVSQSPVLARAAAGGQGLRTLDPAQNLFQIAGANPATAYRTLDLPAPNAWLNVARGLDSTNKQTAVALRVLGIGARVLDPFETRAVGPAWNAGGWGATSDLIRDPTLAGWLYGADFCRINRIEEFRWVEPAEPPARAWRVEIEDGPSPSGPTTLEDFRSATPLEWRSPAPGRVEVTCIPDPRRPFPGVVLPMTFDPEWVATLISPSGKTAVMPIHPLPGGMQTVWSMPVGPPGQSAAREAGRWTLRLDYQGTSACVGLFLSGFAWVGWLGVAVRVHVRDKSRSRSGTVVETA